MTPAIEMSMDDLSNRIEDGDRASSARREQLANADMPTLSQITELGDFGDYEELSHECTETTPIIVTVDDNGHREVLTSCNGLTCRMGLDLAFVKWMIVDGSEWTEDTYVSFEALKEKCPKCADAFFEWIESELPGLGILLKFVK